MGSQDLNKSKETDCDRNIFDKQEQNSKDQTNVESSTGMMSQSIMGKQYMARKEYCGKSYLGYKSCIKRYTKRQVSERHGKNLKRKFNYDSEEEVKKIKLEFELPELDLEVNLVKDCETKEMKYRRKPDEVSGNLEKDCESKISNIIEEEEESDSAEERRLSSDIKIPLRFINEDLVNKSDEESDSEEEIRLSNLGGKPFRSVNYNLQEIEDTSTEEDKIEEEEDDSSTEDMIEEEEDNSSSSTEDMIEESSEDEFTEKGTSEADCELFNKISPMFPSKRPLEVAHDNPLHFPQNNLKYAKNNSLREYHDDLSVKRLLIEPKKSIEDAQDNSLNFLYKIHERPFKCKQYSAVNARDSSKEEDFELFNKIRPMFASMRPHKDDFKKFNNSQKINIGNVKDKSGKKVCEPVSVKQPLKSPPVNIKCSQFEIEDSEDEEDYKFISRLMARNAVKRRIEYSKELSSEDECELIGVKRPSIESKGPSITDDIKSDGEVDIISRINTMSPNPSHSGDNDLFELEHEFFEDIESNREVFREEGQRPEIKKKREFNLVNTHAKLKRAIAAERRLARGEIKSRKCVLTHGQIEFLEREFDRRGLKHTQANVRDLAKELGLPINRCIEHLGNRAKQSREKAAKLLGQFYQDLDDMRGTIAKSWEEFERGRKFFKF